MRAAALPCPHGLFIPAPLPLTSLNPRHLLFQTSLLMRAPLEPYTLFTSCLLEHLGQLILKGKDLINLRSIKRVKTLKTGPIKRIKGKYNDASKEATAIEHKTEL